MGIIFKDLILHIKETDFKRQYTFYLYQLSIWFMKVPHINELKEANKIYAQKAKEHHWFVIYLILSLTRVLSTTNIGNKLGASLTQRWVNHQRNRLYTE